ncbi:MAG: hypothetical protein DMG96_35705 [Acidobacteria bacterium]|nr:MAG: hypothetical protein DMG96_35705 [Acidobacteriota bacterium]
MDMAVQLVMHAYLAAFFVEFKKTVTIDGIIRDFKPDCGIRNLRAAMEFKYAATRKEFSRAIGGIFEDISGYKGSLDWNRFYTVVYQTEAFESEERVKADDQGWCGHLEDNSGHRNWREEAKKAKSSIKSCRCRRDENAHATATGRRKVKEAIRKLRLRKS